MVFQLSYYIIYAILILIVLVMEHELLILNLGTWGDLCCGVSLGRFTILCDCSC